MINTSPNDVDYIKYMTGNRCKEYITCTPFVARPGTMGCDHTRAEISIGIARLNL